MEVGSTRVGRRIRGHKVEGCLARTQAWGVRACVRLLHPRGQRSACLSLPHLAGGEVPVSSVRTAWRPARSHPATQLTTGRGSQCCHASRGRGTGGEGERLLNGQSVLGRWGGA